MLAGLGDEASFVVVTEDALRFTDLEPVIVRLGLQPAWSDLAFVVLTHRGGGPELNPTAARLSDALGNVTFLERPFHAATFISIARTAFKGRQRQYEARLRIEQLHEGEKRLRTALLAGRLGSWELDLTTRVLTASTTCKAFFGRKAGEPLTYDELMACVHPDDQERMQSAVTAAAERGVDYAIEYRNVWPDGSVHWVEIRARRVRDRTGGKPRLVGVSSDITLRKFAEERLKQLNEDLEERVLERTKELQTAHAAMLAEIAQRERTEEKLRQAQKMETIGQLTGGVAHDFNNLLMVVLGNINLLRKHVSDNPTAVRLIEGALQGAQRGAALTQRLLAFAHRQDLTIEPRNLADLIRGMMGLIERSVGSGTEIALDLPQDIPLVLIDANQIELAILNLVINARDAMPNGGLLNLQIDRQEVTQNSDLAPGSYMRVRVSDTGQGMDADTLKKATEPFFSTKGVGKGTGLGLSMVHGLAVQLNGTLRLKSEKGRGTTAELLFPVTTALDTRTEEGSFSVASTEALKMIILVVDDDALVAMGTVMMLEDLGHQVIESHSGEEALQILQHRNDIEILVTDYSMPKMNGAQLAQTARALRPDLPILLATGYAEIPSGSEIDLPRIAKPYQQDQLAAEISRLVALGTHGRQSSQAV